MLESIGEYDESRSGADGDRFGYPSDEGTRPDCRSEAVSNRRADSASIGADRVISTADVLYADSAGP